MVLTVLFAGWYYFTTEIGSVFITDQTKFVYLVILVLGVGVLITVLSTIFATWRFLRSRIDTLYYSLRMSKKIKISHQLIQHKRTLFTLVRKISNYAYRVGLYYCRFLLMMGPDANTTPDGKYDPNY